MFLGLVSISSNASAEACKDRDQLSHGFTFESDGERCMGIFEGEEYFHSPVNDVKLIKHLLPTMFGSYFIFGIYELHSDESVTEIVAPDLDNWYEFGDVINFSQYTDNGDFFIRFSSSIDKDPSPTRSSNMWINFSNAKVKAIAEMKVSENPTSEDFILSSDVNNETVTMTWTITGADGYSKVVTPETLQDELDSLPVGDYKITNYTKLVRDVRSTRKHIYIETLTAEDTASTNFKISGGSVKTKHLYTDSGENVVKPIVKHGIAGTPYETTPLSKDKIPAGYKLNERIDGETNGIFEQDKEFIVAYYYEPIDSSIKVIHRTDQGKVFDEKTYEGKFNESYTTKQNEYEGFELTAIPSNANGKYKVETEVIEYIYTPKKTSVTVMHINEDGHEIAKDVIVKGKYGEQYETKAAKIKGYTLIEQPENWQGELTMDTPAVIYVYEKNKAFINVHFIDEDGNEIAPSELLEGLYSDNYETMAADVEGYFVIEIPKNSEGLYGDQPIDVIYVYKKIKENVITPPEGGNEGGNPGPKPDEEDDDNGNDLGGSGGNSGSESGGSGGTSNPKPTPDLNGGSGVNPPSESGNSTVDKIEKNPSASAEKLPKTGFINSMIILFFGMLMIAVAGGYMYVSRKLIQ